MPAIGHTAYEKLQRRFQSGRAASNKQISRLAAEFRKSTSGNVSMMLALSALPMIAVVGAGIDFARITTDRASFQSAVDSALLSVVNSARASFTGLSQAQIDERKALLAAQAKSFIKANYSASDVVKKSVSVSLTVSDSDITLTANHTLPTSLMGIVGTSALNETLTSSVKKAPRPVELALVMDTTGSMGTTYMAQAKTAAHSLLNNVYGGTLAQKPDSQYVRVALVPFSAAVRLNQNAYDYSSSWIDTTGVSSVSRLNFTDPTWYNYLAWTKLASRPWNGCVEARPGTFATDDSPPSSGTPDSLFVPYFAPDEPTFSGSSSSYRYYNSYIGTPTEYSGATSSPKNSTSSSLNSDLTTLLWRQNNAAKYNGASITSEASSSYGPWFNCDKTPIVPLTYNRANVENGIDAMTSDGSTVIPEGLAWGWKVLSPTAPFTKVEAGPSNAATTIAPYGDPRWRKVMVLMTDGENDVLSSGNQVNNLNGGWYSSYGRIKAATNNRFGTTSVSAANAALDSNMLAICDNIKRQNVEIYTVAFRVSSTNILNNLKTCATDADHAKQAADGIALGTVFSNIGLNVANNTIFLSK